MGTVQEWLGTGLYGTLGPYLEGELGADMGMHVLGGRAAAARAFDSGAQSAMQAQHGFGPPGFQDWQSQLPPSPTWNCTYRNAHTPTLEMLQCSGPDIWKTYV